MQIDPYTPSDWFWFVGGDETKAWSSAAGAYVTEWNPKRLTRIYNEEELSDVLRPYGLQGPYVKVTTVTPRQARLALNAAGLLDQVEATISAADKPTQLTWEYAVEFRRDDPLINGLGAQLGLTDAQIDALFVTASTL